MARNFVYFRLNLKEDVHLLYSLICTVQTNLDMRIFKRFHWHSMALCGKNNVNICNGRQTAHI